MSDAKGSAHHPADSESADNNETAEKNTQDRTDVESTAEEAEPIEAKSDSDAGGDSADDGDSDDSETSPGSFWKWIAVALLVFALAAVGAAGAGFWQYRKANDQLTAIHHADADREAATQAASDYAMRSLTYTFEDPDAFFKNVKDGVAEPLKTKYDDAERLLRAIMLQAQVTSKGEIIATEAKKQEDGNAYQVVITTKQTTRNVQYPQPRDSILVLQITLAKADGKWQVTDIGPKSGSGANTSIMHPGDKLGPPEPPAAPGEAPATDKPVLPQLPGQR